MHHMMLTDLGGSHMHHCSYISTEGMFGGKRCILYLEYDAEARPFVE